MITKNKKSYFQLKKFKQYYWYFVTKIVLTNYEKSDREKLLKFEAEGREFEIFFEKWYFVAKIVKTYCEKKMFQ